MNETLKKKQYHRKYIIAAAVFLLLIIMALDYIFLTRGQKSDITSLVYYWPIDEGQGNIINDIISGKTGSIYGATWTAGITGQALIFDGVDDYVSLSANNPKWLPKNNFTVSIWVYFERDSNYPANEMILDLNYSNSDYSTKEIGCNIIFHALSIPRKLTFQMHTISTTDEDLASDLTIVPDQWYHITIVRNDIHQSLYVNGKLSARRFCSPEPVKFYDVQHGYDDDKVNVGRFTTTLGSPRYYFKGKIDEISIFDGAMSASRIKKIYNNYLNRIPNPLMGDPNNSDFSLKIIRE